MQFSRILWQFVPARREKIKILKYTFHVDNTRPLHEPVSPKVSKILDIPEREANVKWGTILFLLPHQLIPVGYAPEMLQMYHRIYAWTRLLQALFTLWKKTTWRAESHSKHLRIQIKHNKLSSYAASIWLIGDVEWLIPCVAHVHTAKN